jgi:hypothetical protein
MIAGIALEPSLLGRFFPGAVLTALVHSAQSWQRFAVTLFFLLGLWLSRWSRFAARPRSSCIKITARVWGLSPPGSHHARGQLDDRTAGSPMMVVMALLTTFMTTPILMAMKIQPQRDDLAA